MSITLKQASCSRYPSFHDIVGFELHTPAQQATQQQASRYNGFEKKIKSNELMCSVNLLAICLCGDLTSKPHE